MKKIALSITGMAMLLSITAVPAEQALKSPKLLRSYYQLSQALQQGYNVQAIITLDKCTTNDGTPMHTGGEFTRMNFDIFDYYKPTGEDRYAIATAYTHFTEHGKYGPVLGFSRLRVYDDGQAKIHISMLDPVTYQLKETPIEYQCKISAGDDNNGIKLYTN